MAAKQAAFSQFGRKVNAFFLNKLFASVFIAISVLVIVLTSSRFSIWDPETRQERNFLKNYLESSNAGVRNILARTYPETRVHPSIALVTIDDQTLSDEATGLGRWQDFKRSYYAKVIDRLKDDGAVVIGVDVLFSEKSTPAEDAALERSIRRAGNVVLGFSAGGREYDRVKGIKTIPPLYPTQQFLNAAASVGFFNPTLASDDNVYSIKPALLVESLYRESFAFAMLRQYLDVIFGKKTQVGKSNLAYQEYYQFHSDAYNFIPYQSADQGREVLIKYLPKSASFPRISFADVYYASQGRKTAYSPESVKDRIVIIGSTATALHDEFQTPVGTIPGMNVHANLINTVLLKSYVTMASPKTEFALIILLTTFFSLFLLHVGSRAYQIFASFFAISCAVGFYALVYNSFYLTFNYPVELLLVVVLVAISSTAYKYVMEEKGKRLLKNALAQYLAEDVASAVLDNYDEVKLGGERRQVTLFFSDIAGFTTISEKMDPEELVRFLSIYLKEESDIIMNLKGFINKYEGDAIMAIWGAFRDQPDQARLACLSALEQQKKIEEMNRDFETRFGFRISTRMGINMGPAVVGNIGSQGRKIEFTALGDTVNTASRFEGINKLYGTLICVGESVMRDASEEFVFRKLDLIAVKGKEKPTPIYELVGRKGGVSNERMAVIREFERALELYATGEISEATIIFQELVEAYRDPPSETFVERCRKLLETGLPEGWAGVYRATEK